MFLFFKMSGPTLGATKPPFQRVVRDFSQTVKALTCEADHLPPSSANSNKDGSCTSIPPMCLQGILRDNFHTFNSCLTHERFYIIMQHQIMLSVLYSLLFFVCYNESHLTSHPHHTLQHPRR